MEFFLHGGYSHPRQFLRIATEAEAAGFAGVLVPDHVFLPTHPEGAYPNSPDSKPPFSMQANWSDPWVLIGALGAVTTRLKFLTNIFVLALRHPLFVAKSAGTAAAVTDGRVLMGVGVGWQREEFDTLGSPFSKRGRRTDASIDILRRVWRDGRLDQYSDEFFDIPALVMEPRPPRSVPILIGGRTDPAFDRAARIGDGFVAVPDSVDALLSIWTGLQRRLGERGRDPEDFEFRVGCEKDGSMEDFTRLADAGVTGASVRLWPASEEDLDVKLRAIDTFARESLRPFTDRRGQAAAV